MCTSGAIEGSCVHKWSNRRQGLEELSLIGTETCFKLRTCFASQKVNRRKEFVRLKIKSRIDMNII